MYDAPFDSATVVGWILAAVVAGLLAARAVRVEARAGRGTARPTVVRVLDAGLDAVLALAVVALLATLGGIVAVALGLV